MGVILRKRSAFKGLKLPESKITESKSIEHFPSPEKVVLPLQQHIGAPAEPLVKRRDRVKTGQKIADSKSFVSAPIHTSISGEVSGITKIINPATGSLVDAIEIKSDGEDNWIGINQLIDVKDLSKLPEITHIINGLSAKEMIKRIREGGIVGLGGATFPTHVKLSVPPDKKIDTVILNGCECEPYITSDHRVLLEYGEKVLLGLYIINKIISPEKIFIAIENNKKDAIKHLESLIVDMGLETSFKIISLPSRYPMGAEKTLVKTILGREVPIGGLPLDVGVVINNVTTAKAIYEAVVEGRPLIEKVVTVTGAIKRPRNLLVRLGTPIDSIISYCGGLEEGMVEIITGGPMMGISILSLQFPIVKGINCILVREGRLIAEQNCIRCGRCVEACPMNLMPLMFVRNVKNKMYKICSEYFIEDCIECGSCAYVCPANIPIVAYIKTGKSKLSGGG